MIRAKHIMKALVVVLLNHMARVILVEHSISVGRCLVLLVDVSVYLAGHLVGGQEIDGWFYIVREVAK